MVAGSETGNDVERSCKMGIIVDGRSRLADENDLMASYFGNVLSIPFGGKKIQELNEKSLNWVADEVHEFLESAATKEHFLGLIDWVEAHRPVPGLAKIYCKGAKRALLSWCPPAKGFRFLKWISVGGAAFRVVPFSMGRQFRVCDADAESGGEWGLGCVHAYVERAVGRDREGRVVMCSSP
ncbi:hypothetical protein ACLB2K_055057 [Fragaria x ananassa]